jgi:predicted RNase H-related nuclease YkuK (DUF458 family)
MQTKLIKKNQYHSPTKGAMDLKEVIREIAFFISEEPKNKYQIIIGTDSNGGPVLEFVTALIIYRVGRGGRYFWKKSKQKKVPTLRDKIYQEVAFSVATAQEILENLKTQIKKDLISPYDLEIHIDVGEKGKTRNMIKEVVAIVEGNGFNVKTKPNAYGASNVADKYT